MAKIFHLSHVSASGTSAGPAGDTVRQLSGVSPVTNPTAFALFEPIPTRAKVFGWILVLAGCFFAYVYMVTPGAFFPGVTVETFSEKFGLYSTGVRILGSVLGILVALLLNSAALLALMLLTRIFIELGDVTVGLILNGAPDTNTWTLLALAAVETYMLVYLVARIRRR
jgi:hypothetical protein